MEQKLRPVLSVRIFKNAKCFGPGVAQLLHQVQEKHSLRAAAISMGMAYSKAWTVIKSAEKELGFDLLVSVTGGKNGGGATLSPRAETILAAYEEYIASLREFAEARFEETLGPLLENEKSKEQ